MGTRPLRNNASITIASDALHGVTTMSCQMWAEKFGEQEEGWSHAARPG
jgi:hypothetical protein